MRNLPPPSRDNDRDDLRRGVRSYAYGGERHGHDITEDEVETVISLYDRYEADCGQPCDVLLGAVLPASLRDGLYAAHDKTRSGRVLETLRARVFLGVDRCPICGITSATELDHFLPRSVFKPLSIYARNLVPLCHVCNNAKGDAFDAGGEGFIHAYYDILPDVEFLRADVELDGGALKVEFAVDPDAALPEGYQARLTSQMNALNLHVRYPPEVNTYLLSHAISLNLAFRRAGQEGVSTFLRTQADYECDVFYRNHWRPVLLRALADHDDFTGGGVVEVLKVPDAMIDELDV